MEHEVFVPVTTELLRGTLADPARVARCVPGLQRDADADAGPLAGRLRIRVGGHTITYRGALRLAGRDDAWTVEGEGTEARGSGSVKLALTLRLTPTAEGVTLAFAGTAGAEGRLAELPADTVDAAARRLLDRFAAALGTEAERADERAAATDAAPPQAEPDGGASDAAASEGGKGAGAPAGGERAAAGEEAGIGGEAAAGEGTGIDEEVAAGEGTAGGEQAAAGEETAGGGRAATGEESAAGEDTAGGEAAAADDETGSGDEADAGSPSVSGRDVPVPPPSLESLEPLLDDDLDGDADADAPDFVGPPAEAAHARRTMIGRSAEEVDHAPPRGRYAPVPAPETARAGAALRWVAPAAALALASAVVVGRALRRRR